MNAEITVRFQRIKIKINDCTGIKIPGFYAGIHRDDRCFRLSNRSNIIITRNRIKSTRDLCQYCLELNKIIS